MSVFGLRETPECAKRGSFSRHLDVIELMRFLDL